MNTSKKILDICIIVLTALALCVSIAYGYYSIFVHETTTGVNYIGNQTPVDLIERAEDLTEEEIDYYENRYLFNVNYYSNDNENGLQVQEMQLNYFTDQTLEVPTARSTGMQYLGDFQNYIVSDDEVGSAGQYVVPDFTYYDTTNMVNWSGGKLATQLNRDKKFIIKIGDKPYQLQLTGKHSVTSGWWIFSSTKTTYYDYGTIFADVFNLVKKNDYGYGDFYVTLDLSYYFTVYEYDEESKKWVEDNITDEIFTYAVCKIHKDANGMNTANQSIFGMIDGDSSYGIVDATYWQERMVYNLTEENIENNIFSVRYSDTYQGHFISLTLDSKTMFENMDREKINITLNLNSEYLTSKGYNIIGIDYNGFENCKIDTITIIGDTEIFYILDNALKDTDLQTLKHSSDINIEMFSSAINSEYSEVEL